MATITQSAMSNFQSNLTKRKRLCTECCIVLSFFTPTTLADINVRAGVDADAIYQNTKRPDRDDRSLSTFTLEPSVAANYRSATIDATVNGNVVYIDRERNDAGREDTYAEYDYNAQWQPVGRLLTLSASGTRDYGNTNAGNYLVSDFLTNSQGLTKISSQRYVATMLLDQGNYVRTSASLAYATVDSDRTSDSINGLNNDTYSASGNLRNGENATRLFWSLQGSYQETERDKVQNSRGDFVSRRGSGNIDMMIINDWGLRATGTYESNQISDSEGSGSNLREFNSYGAGLIYRQSDTRFLAITANQSESDLNQDDEETFVGAELRWAFSSRTDIAASYGRRFYGDSASGSINYNTKHLRASFNYDENVTNTSRLLSDPQSLGVFVCPLGSASFADCFQPPTLDYELGPGEQEIELIAPNIQFDDNIIVRKHANSQLSYSFSRVSAGLTLLYSEDNYVNQERLRTTYSSAVNITYRLGSYTNLNTRLGYAEIEQTSAGEDSGKSQNWNSSIGLSRRLGRNLRTELEFTFIKKDGDLAAGSLFGSQFTDRRISIGISYQYN